MRNVIAVDPGTPSTTSRCAPVAPATARDVMTLLPAKLNSRNTWSAAFACVQVTTRIVFTFVDTATVTPETYASPAPAPALPVAPPLSAAPAAARAAAPAAPVAARRARRAAPARDARRAARARGRAAGPSIAAVPLAAAAGRAAAGAASVVPPVPAGAALPPVPSCCAASARAAGARSRRASGCAAGSRRPAGVARADSPRRHRTAPHDETKQPPKPSWRATVMAASLRWFMARCPRRKGWSASVWNPNAKPASVFSFHTDVPPGRAVPSVPPSTS